MESDSEQNEFSRFSMGQLSINTTNDSHSNHSHNQSDQSHNQSVQSHSQSTKGSITLSEQSSVDDAVKGNIDDTAEESMIMKPKRMKGKRLILDSDSESEESRSESEEESVGSQPESEEESDERKSESDSDEGKSDSDGFDQRDEKVSNKEDSEEEEKTDNNVSVDENDVTNMSMQNQSGGSSGSKRKSNQNSRNGLIQTSYDSSESDLSLVASKKNLEDSVHIPETDDDEDVDEKERSEIHVFSPRTRRSITGRRSIKPTRIDSDDDDDIFSNDMASESNASMSSDYKSAEVSKDNGTAENWKRNRSIAPNESGVIQTPNPKRFSLNNVDFSSSTPSKSSVPDIEFSDKSNVSGSSSLQISSSHSDTEMKSILNDSVVVLNSSDEENRQPFANSTGIDFKGVGTSTPGTSSKLIQPKLPFGRQAQTKSNKTLVSREYYSRKEDELHRIEQELTHNTELYGKLATTLPDKGANLQRRVADLQRQVQKMKDELDKYAIEEDNLDDVMIVATTNNNQPKNAAKDWRDDLENIQPRWTGQQGLSTFNTQKALTLKRIDKLHKAMEKCPTEHDLARQPDNLNVQLMPHQLYAIKWMRWRENQKPKGGLLADDMGLGKTLTVIGLVLDTKYRKQQSLAEEDEDEDEEENTEDEDESDDENERGYKKSYANQGGTLIICPASLINQWESEINNRVKRRKLTVLLMHGSKRKESVHTICKYDLVITTYGIISSDHKSNGAMFRVRWERIVLDEAHMIRNHTTAVSKGCCDLRGNMRWGLTGTPIQNKHMDVYSMFKFLRVTPFDDLPTYKKWIDPKTEAGMSRLHNILKPMLLRRTKAELQIKGELQALPSKSIVIEDIQLTVDEANIYTKILAYSQTLFAQYMEQHQQRNGGGKFQLGTDIQKRLDQVRKFGRGQDVVKQSQILVLLLRLRQICDHPGLIHQMLQDECDLEDCEDEEYDTTDMNIVKQMIGLKINDGDTEKAHNSSDEEVKSSNILLSTNKMYDFKQPSSKCKRTIEIVKRIMRESNDKIVIVSQWTSFLSIVADFLHREKVHYVELTGKTPIKDRNNIVVSFNNPDSPERVMMLSLVAGGVGLNLTGANHLILLDPHWNPQLESQAFDRVYRVGQTKDVQIYKLLCEKTVEKHIQLIQDNKLTLSENVLTGSKQGSGSKLSIQDMRRLFDM